ncbi:MAG: hypothetical protein P8Y40_10815, partial [Desulfobacterales bacterium]
MKNINIGLLGCGTVGTGVARMLLNGGELIKSRVGEALTLKRVADIDTTKDRGVRFAPGVLIEDAWAVVNDPGIDIVVEMIGGESNIVYRPLPEDDLHAKAHIQANPSRAIKPPLDPDLYAERHKVENFFQRIKRFRRIALRCEKTLSSFMGFVFLVSAL